MSPTQALRTLSIKDWIAVITAVFAVVGSWYIMKAEVSASTTAIMEFKAAQKERDSQQDSNIKEIKQELVQAMNRNTDEIKQEIRELRRELKPSK